MWSLIIVEKKEGFSYYSTMEVDEVNIEDESLHISGGNTEMWLQRSNCVVVSDTLIDYRGNGIEVYIERCG